MNSSRSAGLVRRWVALYTRGLAHRVRDARRDEIESDIWSQREEAREIGRSDGSVAGEMLTRLVLGIPADISWRLEQASPRRRHGRVARSVTMGSRVVGLLAILGGSAFIACMAIYIPWLLIRPHEVAWRVITDPTQSAIWSALGLTGVAAISSATIGLAYLYNDRVSPIAVIIGVTGGVAGFTVLLQLYAAILLVPIASATLVLAAAWARLMNPWIAGPHALGAAGFVVALWAGMLSGGTGDGWGLAIAVVYAASWILIGVSILRGVPAAQPSKAHA